MYKHILVVIIAALSLVDCQQTDQDALHCVAKASSDSSDVGTQGKSTDKTIPAQIMFQSTDDGQSWQDISANLPKGADVGSLLAIDDKVYLHGENGFYSSSTKQNLPVWEKEILPDTKIKALYSGKSGLYAYGLGCGFYLNMQGSGIWIPINNIFKGKAVNTFLEAKDGSVFIGSDNAIFKSTDGFKTWKSVFEGDMIYRLFIADDILFAEGLNGLIRSTDNGEHWKPMQANEGRAIKTVLINGGIAAIFMESDSVQSGNILNSTGNKNSLLTSTDGGMTWDPIDENLPFGRNIYDIEQAGEYLFCSLDTGIYRSHDQGKTWELVYTAAKKERFELVATGKTVFAMLSQGC